MNNCLSLKNMQKRIWKVQVYKSIKLTSLGPTFPCITREAHKIVQAWLAVKNVHSSKFFNAFLNFSSIQELR